MSDSSNVEQTLHNLRDLLVQENEALLAGRAGTASALLEKKKDAMKGFDEIMQQPALVRSTRGAPERIEEIVALSSENARHFAAVRNGMTSAINRLSNMSTTSYVGAYGADGGKTAFSKAVGGYERKI